MHDNPLKFAPSATVPQPLDAPMHTLAGVRVRVQNMGCRVNRYDAAQIRAELAAAGAELVETETAPCDLFVLNTCTVTHQADSEARRLARRVKRRQPEARVAFTGCYAEVAPEAVAALPEVDLVVGNRHKPQLVQRLSGLMAGVPVPVIETPPVLFGAGAGPLPDQGGDTRFFLKVQEGCNVACAFCIIPAARGRSRSMTPDDVVHTIRQAQAAGYREVVLAGIHLGGYGEELSPAHDFCDLLEAVLTQTTMPRIRFGSLEPWGLSDRFVELFGAHDRLLPFLHLPLQSGSASVLKRMRRPCTPEFYRTQVQKILAAKSDLFLSTDVMAGFPGESDAEFEATVTFIRSLPFCHLHVFPYSVRSGTVAAKLDGQVDPKVRTARTHRLIDLSDGLMQRALAKQVGKVTDVLVEAAGKGHTHNNYPVVLQGTAASRAGAVVRVLITGCDARTVYGEPVA